MKILLLGKSGQLGSDIFDYLNTSEKVPEVTALTRDDIDVSDLETLRDKLSEFDYDVLINCTSIHKTDDIEANSSLAFTVNAHAVKVMAEASRTKRAKFYHISTDYVFGGEKYVEPITEFSPCSPINVYGSSKALGEQFAKITNDKTFIVRVASLFGVRGASGKGGNFIETMIRMFSERDNVTVVSDQIMSPTFTEDVAKAICKSIEYDIEPGIYHIVNSGSGSWYELAKYVSNAQAF